MTPKRDLDERLDVEIRFHIEEQTEKNIRAGLTPGEARRQAVLRFGNAESAREYTRDEFRLAWLHELGRDVRVAVRMWQRSRGAAAVAILTLAIGIGANTAIFSVLHALVLNPLPYPHADRLVAIWDSSERSPRNEVAFANFADWKKQQTSFEMLGLYRWWSANLTGDNTPERVQGFQLTADAVSALGLAPRLGRWFNAAENEPEGDRVALLGYGLWQRRFGGDPGVLGKTIVINGVRREVIGVMPEAMNFPQGADIVAPLTVTPEIRASRRFHSYYVVGRLKPGVALADAQADIGTIAARLARDFPDTNKGLGVRVLPLTDDVAHDYKNALWLLMASVTFVLLIACANLVNLLLARAPARGREFAVRASMGASRARLVRQVLIESLVLAGGGGLLGAGLAVFAVQAAKGAVPADLRASVPGLAGLSVNGEVLGFTLALTVLTGLAFALLPALRSSAIDNAALRGAGRPRGAIRGGRVRGALVATEVALALMLLSGAGFTLRALSRLVSMEKGFESDHVITMGITLPYARYVDEASQALFFSRLHEAARAIPGITSAGLTSHVPLAPGNGSSGLVFEGRPTPDQDPEADYRVISTGYLETLRARVVRGRAFREADGASASPVMIVNQAFVRRFFDGQEAVGRRVRFSGAPKTNPWREIVGVIADIRHNITRPPPPESYIPYTQGTLGTMFVVAKTREDARAMAPALRAAVLALDPNQPVW
ncbi:MAG: ABC transporter permease, partial [Vicinamibacteria bacterium]